MGGREDGLDLEILEAFDRSRPRDHVALVEDHDDRRPALEALDIDRIESDGYVFQIETTYKTILNGFRVVEAPIHFIDRVAGKSKLSRRIVVEAMLVVWKLKFERMLGRI